MRKMKSIRTDEIMVIAGMRGTGKTEFIKKLTSTLAIPYTVYDVLDQYKGSCCHGTFKTGHLGTFQKRPLLVGN
jgi:hypothetical protein